MQPRTSARRFVDPGPSIHRSNDPSIHRSIYPSIHPSNYPSTVQNQALLQWCCSPSVCLFAGLFVEVSRESVRPTLTHFTHSLIAGKSQDTVAWVRVCAHTRAWVCACGWPTNTMPCSPRSQPRRMCYWIPVCDESHYGPTTMDETCCELIDVPICRDELSSR